MNICNCKEDLSAYLCDIPIEWKDGIVKSLCYIMSDDCEESICNSVKDCETTTYLSPFTVNNNEVSISYKSEKNIKIRSIDIISLINAALINVNPQCLTSQQAWNLMSYREKLQLLITAMGVCCCTTT